MELGKPRALSSRDFGRSENLGGEASSKLGALSALPPVEIGLTDLPNTEGCASPCPPLLTALSSSAWWLRDMAADEISAP